MATIRSGRSRSYGQRFTLHGSTQRGPLECQKFGLISWNTSDNEPQGRGKGNSRLRSLFPSPDHSNCARSVRNWPRRESQPPVPLLTISLANAATSNSHDLRRSEVEDQATEATGSRAATLNHEVLAIQGDHRPGESIPTIATAEGKPFKHHWV